MTEAGSDLILQAATGGSKAVIGFLTKGAKLIPDVPGGRKIPGGDRTARTCSFDGATLVRTMAGFRFIRDIKAGSDQVWARDARTGAMGYRLVEAQYSNPYDVTVRGTIRDAETGKTQTIVSNKIHPFFVQLPEGAAPVPSSEGHRYEGTIARGTWVDASELKAGYRLLSDDGSWAVVSGVTVTQAPLTAYNLTVNGFHTYFVTGNADASPVWVHNDCKVEDFEKSLVRVPPGERVALVKTRLKEVATANDWTPNGKLSRMNGRDVYEADSKFYAVDSQHDRFEVHDKRGNHLYEVQIDGTPVRDSRDPTKKLKL